MSDDNIAIRLKFLVEKLGINSSQFADECKIPRPTFSQILNGRNKKLSNQIITQIHNSYPNVSINWLLFNEGPAFIGAPVLDNATPDIDDSFSLNNSNENGGAISPEANSEKKSYRFLNSGEENQFQNPKYPGEYTDSEKEDKDSALNSAQKHSINSDFKEVNTILENAELMAELNKMRQKQRKVVSVTIYYDDSTFETFKPA